MNIINILKGKKKETFKEKLKKRLKKLGDELAIKHVKEMKLPEFEEDKVKRYRMVFKGKVQKVGFRAQLLVLAERLGLTGFCHNKSNGDVIAEIQGPENKILYAIRYMGVLERIHVKDKKAKHIPIKKNEKGFFKH